MADGVQGLGRPRGVDHLNNLVTKGVYGYVVCVCGGRMGVCVCGARMGMRACVCACLPSPNPPLTLPPSSPSPPLPLPSPLGALNMALDAMEPTREAAALVLDIVQAAVSVARSAPPHIAAMASLKGLFALADAAANAARSSLAATSAAADVNAEAVKAMGWLSSLGELARVDDQVSE